MLVLTRKQGQTVKIGDDIAITVLGIHGNVLRLGIEAPRNVRVLRSELQPWDADEADHHSRELLLAR